jgi:hypothetical protein
MAGLVPAIHAVIVKTDDLGMGRRDKPTAVRFRKLNKYRHL